MASDDDPPASAETEEEAPEPGKRRRRRRWPIVLGVVLLVLAGVTARMFIWPDLPPLPDHADAVIELGGPGNRDAAALTLAREGRAPFLVQSTRAAEAGTDRCLPPVPGVTILCFNPVPDTTQGEARAIGELAARYHWASVILVTSPDHAWRARLWVSRCFPGGVAVSTTHLPFLYWFRQIPYQWGASIKALTVDRSC
jgi:uncharacterized SAM-binding protein YcdF (DUF218 family)